MSVDPVGVALGVTGLLIAFKGAVDSFVLIDAIVEADNGSRYLSLKYFIEKHKLSVWADHFRIYNPNESQLADETTMTQKFVLAILTEIEAINVSARKYLERYKMLGPQVGDTIVGDNLAINSSVIQSLAADRASSKQHSRFRWATKDKEKFSQLVGRLQTLVSDLYTLVRANKDDSLSKALLVDLLAAVSDQDSLSALQQPSSGTSELISLSAHLKQLQTSAATLASSALTFIDFGSLEFTGSSFPEGNWSPQARHICYYSGENSLEQRAWVEWKVIEPKLNSTDQSELRKRIEALGKLLTTNKLAEFRIPLCLGITETSIKCDTPGSFPITERRFGYVYAYPGVHYDNAFQLQSLKELINTRPMPLLSERFRLAYMLASSMSLFHAAKWLHKGFRSSNILFFKPTDGDLSITDPYVTGFEFARPWNTPSIEKGAKGDISIDMYQHPAVAELGFTQIRDYYSLGVVLFEIGLWRSFDLKIPRDKKIPLSELTMGTVHQILQESYPILGGVMGPVYRDVVGRCLTGDFGLIDENSVEVGRNFFQKVVRQLESCRA